MQSKKSLSFLEIIFAILIFLLPVVISASAFYMQSFSYLSSETLNIILLICTISILIIEATPFIFTNNAFFKFSPFILFGSVVFIATMVFSAKVYFPNGIENMVIETIEPLILGILIWISLYLFLFEKRPSLKENTRAIIACVILIILNSLTEGAFLANTKDDSIKIVIKIIGVGYDILGAMIVYRHFTNLPVKNVSVI